MLNMLFVVVETVYPAGLNRARHDGYAWQRTFLAHFLGEIIVFGRYTFTITLFNEGNNPFLRNSCFPNVKYHSTCKDPGYEL